MTDSALCHFTKTLERDGTLFVQGSWAQGLDVDMADRFGMDNPYHPMVATYATEDSVQIWENMTSVQWMLDAFYEQNRIDTSFIRRVIDEYVPLLNTLKEYWRTDVATSAEDAAAYAALVRKASLNISTCYYVGMDERTQQAALDLVIAVREEDSFYASNDDFVRKCVTARDSEKAPYAAFVLPHELYNLPSLDELRKRAGGCLLIAGKDLYVETLERFAAQHPDYVFHDLITAAEEVHELRGQVAQRGNVTGRVRVVRNQREMTAVEKGDILVAPMTTPDFLPAMKKAAAFVTNEGGITCHAAIVSREFKKPCIIGTKIATNVLHDGDLVEVDAERGVVTILERKK